MSTPRHPSETRPSRMGPLARLPVFFDLKGKRAIVAGDNEAVVWKAELLSACGAEVHVFAAGAAPPNGSVRLHERSWDAADFEGAAIAVGSFSDEKDAARFSDAAREAGVPVNIVDNKALSDFSFGSIVNRSPLVIGISTDGAAPALAQSLRAKLKPSFRKALPAGPRPRGLGASGLNPRASISRKGARSGAHSAHARCANPIVSPRIPITARYCDRRKEKRKDKPGASFWWARGQAIPSF